MTLKIDAKSEEKLICCFKTDKNFDPRTHFDLILHFDWSLP